MSQSSISQPQHSPSPSGTLSDPMAHRQVGKSSPWRPRFAALALILVVGAVSSACNNDDDQSTADDATQSSTAEVPSTPAPSSVAITPPTTTTVPTQPPATESEAATSFVMPDFVGLDLQSAQDLVQTNGVFYSVSHDLLGSRNQVVDSNWVVCTQNIPAGQSVSSDAEGGIDFGVVKREERCP